MKVSPGTGRIPGATVLKPTFRITEWYGDPDTASLAYDELLASEVVNVTEVIDWILARHRSVRDETGTASALHSTELWLLTPSHGGRTPIQTLLGTYFVNSTDQPVPGTHSICDSTVWTHPERPEPATDPTAWQRELAEESGEIELTIRSVAIAEAVNHGVPYSTSMLEADSDRLRALTIDALRRGEARRY